MHKETSLCILAGNLIRLTVFLRWSGMTVRRFQIHFQSLLDMKFLAMPSPELWVGITASQQLAELKMNCGRSRACRFVTQTRIE